MSFTWALIRCRYIPPLEGPQVTGAGPAEKPTIAVLHSVARIALLVWRITLTICYLARSKAEDVGSGNLSRRRPRQRFQPIQQFHPAERPRKLPIVPIRSPLSGRQAHGEVEAGLIELLSRTSTFSPLLFFSAFDSILDHNRHDVGPSSRCISIQVLGHVQPGSPGGPSVCHSTD